MALSWLSILTLITEIVMTFIIIYVFRSGYKYKRFPYRLVFVALIYEFLFNMGYMIYRAISHSSSGLTSSFRIMLAIIHGTLSLVMFIALIVLFMIAWKNYARGVNYFKKHKSLMIIFMIFWFLSLISGILFFIIWNLI